MYILIECLTIDPLLVEYVGITMDLVLRRLDHVLGLARSGAGDQFVHKQAVSHRVTELHFIPIAVVATPVPSFLESLESAAMVLEKCTSGLDGNASILASAATPPDAGNALDAIEIVRDNRQLSVTRHPNALPTRCQFCGDSGEACLTHIQEHHTASEAGILCNDGDCENKAFPTLKKYLQHLLSMHHEMPSHPCPEPGCLAVAKTADLLTAHQARMHSGKDLTCRRDCGFRTKDSSTINQHETFTGPSRT